MPVTNPHKRRRVGDGEGVSIQPNVLKILWVNVLAACSLALRLVSVPQFRAFLSYLNSDIDTWLPSSHNTIRNWVGYRAVQGSEGSLKDDCTACQIDYTYILRLVDVTKLSGNPSYYSLFHRRGRQPSDMCLGTKRYHRRP
jgi:hypothetical protein